MNDDVEWEGEPHAIVVTKVEPPDGEFDEYHLEYEIEHPPSCPQEDFDGGSYTDWNCELGWLVREEGLEFPLRYSGTPITKPGTYHIASWGRKYYVWDCAAYEYDSGIAVVEPGGTDE
jgi:hypothetical protein